MFAVEIQQIAELVLTCICVRFSWSSSKQFPTFIWQSIAYQIPFRSHQFRSTSSVNSTHFSFSLLLYWNRTRKRGKENLLNMTDVGTELITSLDMHEWNDNRTHYRSALINEGGNVTKPETPKWRHFSWPHSFHLGVGRTRLAYRDILGTGLKKLILFVASGTYI